jgi:[ribosomal protein S5]-alanine N-acetyltransferase
MKTFLRTEHFELTGFDENDIGNVFAGLSNPEVIKYYGVSYDSLEATKLQMDWFSDLEKNHTGQWWAIRTVSTKEFAGGIGFNNFHAQHFSAEIGFWLLPEFWGKGVLTEIIPIVFSDAVSNWNLHRMEAVVETENKQCIRLLEKTGFIFEGRKRESEYKNGKFIDLNIYAKLAG